MNHRNYRPRNGHRYAATPPSAPPDPLLADWAAQLRTEQKATRTVAAYTRNVQRFAEKIGVSPASACRADVLDWFDANPHWSGNTAGQNYTALAQWFKWLLLEGHRDDNPMARIAAPAEDKGEPRPVSNAELVRMLTLPRLHHKTRVMIMLAAFAGLRVSEIARVRGADVDLSGQVLWVLGKGRKRPVSVPLHPVLARAAASMPRTDYWFPSRSHPGKPMLSTCVTSGLSNVMARAGVRGTPHSLRHWYGTALLANGADLRTVQECMRHANIATTQLYTRVPDDRRREAIASLDPFGMVGAGV